MIFEVLKKPIHFSETSGPKAELQTFQASFKTAYDLKELFLVLNVSDKEPLFFFENKQGDQYLGLFPQEANEQYTLNRNQFLFSLRTFEKSKSQVYWCNWQFKASPMGNGQFLVTITTTNANPTKALKELFHSDSPNRKGDLDLNLLDEIPQKNAWTTLVERALERLQNSKDPLSKVVLARKLRYLLKGNINERDLFHMMANKAAKNLFKIFISEFEGLPPYLSFTPESLHYLEQNTLHLEAIAGTRPLQENNPKQNEQWAQELLNDPKEKEEHQAVVDLIFKKASEIGPPIKSETRILKLKGVQHLHTPIKVSLGEDKSVFKIIDIMDQLHPTPAICGSPSEMAKTFINENEGQRGLYAGLIGIHEIDRSESAVLIRGLHTTRNEDSLELISYGGAGIVKDSHPDKEWEETANKVNSFLSLITGETKTHNLKQHFNYEIKETPTHTKGASLEN